MSTTRRYTPSRTYKRTTKGYRKPTKSELQREIRKELIRTIEPKCLDYSLDTATVTTTGVAVNLTALITQGSAARDQRIGDQIKLRSLVFRSRALAVSEDSPVFGRLIVAIGKGNQGLTTSEVLEDVGSDKCVISMKNFDFRKNYNILYDSGCFMAETSAAASDTYSDIYWNSGLVVIPMTNYTVDYDSGSTGCNNRVMLMYFSAGTNDISYKLQARLNYFDS